MIEDGIDPTSNSVAPGSGLKDEIKVVKSFVKNLEIKNSYEFIKKIQEVINLVTKLICRSWKLFQTLHPQCHDSVRQHSHGQCRAPNLFAEMTWCAVTEKRHESYSSSFISIHLCLRCKPVQTLNLETCTSKYTKYKVCTKFVQAC